MAKTRAQRKAERRRREAQVARQRDGDSQAARRTQVPESADVVEAELAERGADLDELTESDEAATADVVALAEAAAPEAPAAEPEAPAPSRADVGRPEPAAVEVAEEPAAVEVAEEPADRISRRARREAERERKRLAKESQQRRERREAAPERQRGRVIGFFISCWAELKRVQWPDRDTLIQASAVTILFIAIAAAYLGALDSLFNFLVQHLL
jgi:preprotein translocase SecE subunit